MNPKPTGTADRQGRALELARSLNAEAVLTAAPATVTWLTGFATGAETGPDPYSLPPIAFISADRPPSLVVESDLAAAVARHGLVPVELGGFTIEPIRHLRSVNEVIGDLIGSRKVATELGSLPAVVAAQLTTVDATEELARLRMVKDSDEIALLRELITICDAGQVAARAALQSEGMTELDLWTAAQTAMELAAGSRLTIVADLIAGKRTAGVSGDPLPNSIGRFDPVICDLIPRRDGYWGDSTSTFMLEPRAEHGSAWARVAETLDRLLEHVRPGVSASELDQIGRAALGYPHHTGHGLGTTYHEEPRIVPSNACQLTPDMVIALEPALYTDEFGIRLEVVVLVTDDGCELLSTHPVTLLT